MPDLSGTLHHHRKDLIVKNHMIYVSFPHLILIVVACVSVDSWALRAIMIALWIVGLWQTGSAE